MYHQQNKKVSDGRRVALLHRAPTAVQGMQSYSRAGPRAGLVLSLTCCDCDLLPKTSLPFAPAVCWPSSPSVTRGMGDWDDSTQGECSLQDLPAQGRCSSVIPKGMVRAELSALIQDLLTYFLPHTYI